MQFFKETHIDFIGKRNTYFIVSLVTVLVTMFGALLSGVEFGIDFVGGSEIAVEFKSGGVSTSDIRSALEKSGFSGTEIKSFGQENQFLIRVRQSSGGDAAAMSAAQVSEGITAGLAKNIPGNTFTVLKVDTVGGKVSAEFGQMALLAVLLAVLAILVYIGLRFELIFGLGAIIALVHDLLIAFALSVILNKAGLLNLEITKEMIAAFLTVLGYSINDTVIIFDRIRENRELHKNMSFVDVVNLSINDTLSRTINTALTVIAVLVPLIFFGGDVLEGFAFAMLVGVIVGIYSSVYISSAFVVWYLENVKKVNVNEGGNRASKKVKTA